MHVVSEGAAVDMHQSLCLAEAAFGPGSGDPQTRGASLRFYHGHAAGVKHYRFDVPGILDKKQPVLLHVRNFSRSYPAPFGRMPEGDEEDLRSYWRGICAH